MSNLMPIQSVVFSLDFQQGTDQETVAVNGIIATLVDEIVVDGKTATMKGS